MMMSPSSTAPSVSRHLDEVVRRFGHSPSSAFFPAEIVGRDRVCGVKTAKNKGGECSPSFKHEREIFRFVSALRGRASPSRLLGLGLPGA